MYFLSVLSVFLCIYYYTIYKSLIVTHDYPTNNCFVMCLKLEKAHTTALNEQRSNCSLARLNHNESLKSVVTALHLLLLTLPLNYICDSWHQRLIKLFHIKKLSIKRFCSKIHLTCKLVYMPLRFSVSKRYSF